MSLEACLPIPTKILHQKTNVMTLLSAPFTMDASYDCVTLLVPAIVTWAVGWSHMSSLQAAQYLPALTDWSEPIL
jgi:hypothetical protein